MAGWPPVQFPGLVFRAFSIRVWLKLRYRAAVVLT